MNTARDAIFVPDGNGYLPTEHAVGPWNPEHLHGGAAAALMMAAVEDVVPGSPMVTVRATVELMRPVPRGLLQVGASVLRPGRKVQLVGASLTADGDEVARATVLRIREADVDLPESARRSLEDAEAPAPPADTERGGVGIAGFGQSMSIVFERGAFTELGPSRVWFRLRRPVIEGRETSGLQRVMAAADFGNGVSSVVDWTSHLFINPDLTVYLHRRPVGEWICLDARSVVSGSGVGMAESVLFDAAGPLGRSIQALLVDTRP